MSVSAVARTLAVGRGLALALADASLALLAPARCAACGIHVGARFVFCPPCARTVERTTGAARLLGSFAYGGAIASAIIACKYEQRVDVVRRLAHLLLAEREQLEDERFTCAIPVPLHPVRLVERGYNVPALLLSPLARALGIPLVTRRLVRLRPTVQQVSLPRPERVRNVAGAFAVRRAAERPLRGARVLLLDDVQTTGATLHACAAALRAAGAETVVARALAVSLDGAGDS